MLESNKENRCPPKKQGILYSIFTGKNNGVYLPKDISYQNHKSLDLLTKQAQQSHKSYVDTLKLIQKQKQTEMKNNTNLLQVQCFSENYSFDIKHISDLKTNLTQYSTHTKQLKQQLQKLTAKITTQNTILYEGALPALKTLKQKIKQNKQQQMATYSKMHRELQKVQQCFLVVGNGIRECDRKIQVAQKIYRRSQSCQ